MQRGDQPAQAGRSAAAGESDVRFPRQRIELLRRVFGQPTRLGEVAAAEVEPQHWMPCLPIPLVVDGEASEQFFAALEQLLDGVQQQTLAEPPRARQKVVPPLRDQTLDQGGLVDVVAAALADQPEGLDADRQLALGGCVHAGTVAACAGGLKGAPVEVGAAASRLHSVAGQASTPQLPQ